jgi:hypothetical protein
MGGINNMEKLTQKQVLEVMNLVRQQFRDTTVTLKEGKLHIPSVVFNYAKARLFENITMKLGSYKIDVTIFILEQAGSTYYLTRNITDIRNTSTVSLTPDDIKDIKDIKKITKQEFKELINKVDAKEKRFGL